MKARLFPGRERRKKQGLLRLSLITGWFYGNNAAHIYLVYAIYLTGVRRSFKKPVLVFTRETLDLELVIQKAHLLILFANLFFNNFSRLPRSRDHAKKTSGTRGREQVFFPGYLCQGHVPWRARDKPHSARNSMKLEEKDTNVKWFAIPKGE